MAAGGVALKDLVLFQELGKSRAEAAFRLEVERSRGGQPEIIAAYESKLSAIARQIGEITGKMERAGVRLAIPNEEEIFRLNSILSTSSAGQLADAMGKRGGSTYETLAARGALLKRNFEDRENIAKLALLLSHLQKDVREALADEVRKGRLGKQVPILKGEEPLGRKLALVLGRLGMPAELREGALVPAAGTVEVPIQLQNRRVWVTAEVHEKLNANLKKIQEISPQIQMKNAVRQVKLFSDAEEKEFADIQNEYLKLLKEQDELLKDFSDEENF